LDVIASMAGLRFFLTPWRAMIEGFLNGLIPSWLAVPLNSLALRPLGLADTRAIVAAVSVPATLLLVVLAFGYILFFFAYALVRRLSVRLDRQQYRSITGFNPQVSWKGDCAAGDELPDLQRRIT